MVKSAHDELETARLKALEDYEILDTVAEAAFDRLTRLASAFYHSPIALISLVDQERQWFKSRVGLDAQQTPRELAFCHHAIKGDIPFVVPDASKDPRFASNPLVTSAPYIRFYAGAPLKTPSGHNIGTLCIIDQNARPEFSVQDAGQLELLAQIVISEMESRLQAMALEKAMKEVEAATKARADFLSLVSHEIRTPLTAVVGLTDRLADKADAPPEPKLVQGLQSSSRQLMGLLNDVLDFAKLEAGKITIKPSQVNPQELFKHSAETWRPAAEAKGLAFSLTLDPSLPDRILIDELRLSQVLNNILSNAVKFTGKGDVKIHADAAEATCLTIRVSDTGCGMTEEQLSRLFQPFEQADHSTSRRHGGTGLGMSICRQLVELMDGSIDCTSCYLFGTSFTLTLPFEEVAQETSTRSRQILIVDDVPLNCELTYHMLTKLGHKARYVTSGREAIAASRDQSFDVIFMDVRMPEMDGFQATQRIHACNPHQKIIALSADDSEDDRGRAKALGMIGYLRKPVTLETLNSAITDLDRH